jgi:hypothetical protein
MSRSESTGIGWIIVSSEIDTCFKRVGKDAFRSACFLHQQLETTGHVLAVMYAQAATSPTFRGLILRSPLILSFVESDQFRSLGQEVRHLTFTHSLGSVKFIMGYKPK